MFKYLQLTGKRQLISLNQYSSPNFIQRGARVPLIPSHCRLLLARVQVQNCAFQRQCLSTLQESLFAHSYFRSCEQITWFTNAPLKMQVKGKSGKILDKILIREVDSLWTELVIGAHFSFWWLGLYTHKTTRYYYNCNLTRYFFY